MSKFLVCLRISKEPLRMLVTIHTKKISSAKEPKTTLVNTHSGEHIPDRHMLKNIVAAIKNTQRKITPSKIALTFFIVFIFIQLPIVAISSHTINELKIIYQYDKICQ